MHRHFSKGYHSLPWNMVWIMSGRLGHMFVDPRHIADDMECNDDDEDEHLEGDDGIMEFDGLMNMKQNDLPMGAIVGSNDTINSSTPTERALAQLVTIM